MKQDVKAAAKDIGSEGRFIAYDNGTVLDTRTNLMWAAKDNGNNIKWADAKFHCENYRGAGYMDWRMPTQNELAGLYDEAKTYKPDCEYNVHLTDVIHLTCHRLWASETYGSYSEAASFNFHHGLRHFYNRSIDDGYRALPVRSGK